MIKPYNRHELYIAALSDDSLTIPDMPYSREETYLAKINGQNVTIPAAPANRYETYLAKLAGGNVTVPTPVSRLEFFLYKACGEDCDVPEPVTREEVFWNDYCDSLPKDLMRGVKVEPGNINSTGQEVDGNHYRRTDFIPVTGITSIKIDVKMVPNISAWYLRVNSYNDDNVDAWRKLDFTKTVAATVSTATYTADITGASYIRLSYRAEAEIHVYDTSGS